VSFAVEHFVALLDSGLADGLCQVAFARAAGTEKQRIFTPLDEGAGGEVEDDAAIHLRVEGEIEIVERFVSVAETGLLAAALEQTAGAARELVRDQ